MNTWCTAHTEHAPRFLHITNTLIVNARCECQCAIQLIIYIYAMLRGISFNRLDGSEVNEMNDRKIFSSIIRNIVRMRNTWSEQNNTNLSVYNISVA